MGFIVEMKTEIKRSDKQKMPKIFLVTADTLQHGYTTSRLARERHSEPFSAKSEANTV